MEERRKLHPAWVILGICFVTLFINYSVRLGFGVVLPEMVRTLGFSRTAAGSIYNAYLFTYIAVSPLAGYLTDRLGARCVISFCMVLVGAGSFLLGTVESLWAACVFFAIAGLGSTGVWVPITTLIQRWFAFPRRGLALGVLSTGYGLGFAVVGVGFPWVVTHLDWRYAWYILGVLAFLVTVPNAVFLRSDPSDRGLAPWGQGRETGHPLPPRAARVTLREILRERNFWAIGASYFAVAYGLYGITTFMVDYAAHQLGIPLEKASQLASIHGLFQVVGVLTVLPVSDAVGRRPAIIVSNALIAVLLAALLFTGGYWWLLCGLVAGLAVCYGATFPIYAACAGDYFPRQAMGTVAGAWTPFYGLGAILTHWVTGGLRDALGTYDVGFGICAFMAAASVVLMGMVRPPAAARRPS